MNDILQSGRLACTSNVVQQLFSQALWKYVRQADRRRPRTLPRIDDCFRLSWLLSHAAEAKVEIYEWKTNSFEQLKHHQLPKRAKSHQHL